MVGLYMGDRSQQSAQHLWDSLPSEYRENAVSYTDFWEAYAAVFPVTRHLAVGKETGIVFLFDIKTIRLFLGLNSAYILYL